MGPTKTGFNGAAAEARKIAAAVLDKLDRIVEATQVSLAEDEFQYVRKVLTVSATDTVVQDFAQPPPGVTWIVKRISVTGDAAGTFLAYIDEVQPQNLVESQPLSGGTLAWGVAGDGLWVPAGRQLWLRFIGQPASRVCTVNLRVTAFRHSGEDRAS